MRKNNGKKVLRNSTKYDIIKIKKQNNQRGGFL